MSEESTGVASDSLPTEPVPELAGGPPAGDGREVPWKGRKRVADPRDKVLRIRCSTAELERMNARATEAGLSLGAFLRTAGTGQGGPRAVKRPKLDTDLLTRLLGLVGNMASNHNQIGKWCNTEQSPATAAELAAIKADVAAIRADLMKALYRGD